MVEFTTNGQGVKSRLLLANSAIGNSCITAMLFTCFIFSHKFLFCILANDRIFALMESSKETGSQVPEGPFLCINNCGFFGTAATMNMCSKCHKDTIMKQQHTKLADSSIENLVNGGSGTNVKEPVMTDAMDVQAGAVESKASSKQTTSDLYSGQSSAVKTKDGPNRCTACHKRVGLTGFNCRCGNLFCSVHRYSDKHDCSFDYRMGAQDAIAKANPTVKAEKLDKI